MKGQYTFEEGSSFEQPVEGAKLVHPTKERPKFNSRRSLKITKQSKAKKERSSSTGEVFPILPDASRSKKQDESAENSESSEKTVHKPVPKVNRGIRVLPAIPAFQISFKKKKRPAPIPQSSPASPTSPCLSGKKSPPPPKPKRRTIPHQLSEQEKEVSQKYQNVGEEGVQVEKTTEKSLGDEDITKSSKMTVENCQRNDKTKENVLLKLECLDSSTDLNVSSASKEKTKPKRPAPPMLSPKPSRRKLKERKDEELQAEENKQAITANMSQNVAETTAERSPEHTESSDDSTILSTKMCLNLSSEKECCDVQMEEKNEILTSPTKTVCFITPEDKRDEEPRVYPKEKLKAPKQEKSNAFLKSLSKFGDSVATVASKTSRNLKQRKSKSETTTLIDPDEQTDEYVKEKDVRETKKEKEEIEKQAVSKPKEKYKEGKKYDISTGKKFEKRTSSVKISISSVFKKERETNTPTVMKYKKLNSSPHPEKKSLIENIEQNENIEINNNNQDNANNESTEIVNDVNDMESPTKTNLQIKVQTNSDILDKPDGREDKREESALMDTIESTFMDIRVDCQKASKELDDTTTNTAYEVRRGSYTKHQPLLTKTSPQLHHASKSTNPNSTPTQTDTPSAIDTTAIEVRRGSYTKHLPLLTKTSPQLHHASKSTIPNSTPTQTDTTSDSNRAQLGNADRSIQNITMKPARPAQPTRHVAQPAERSISYDDSYKEPSILKSYSMVTYTPQPPRRKIDENGRIMDKRTCATNNILRTLSVSLKYENKAKKTQKDNDRLIENNEPKRRHTFSTKSNANKYSWSRGSLRQKQDKEKLINEDSDDDNNLNEKLENSSNDIRYKEVCSNGNKNKRTFGVTKKYNL